MIKTYMDLNLNGIWEERQIFPRLKIIMNKEREYFNGKEV